MSCPQRGQVDAQASRAIALAALASAEVDATGACPEAEATDRTPVTEGDTPVR